MLAGERFEIVAIVYAVFVADAEKQCELFGVRMRKIVRSHGAERRDAGAGGDEQRFLGGIANDEESQRRGHFDGVARLHLEKMGSKNAFLNQIETQFEAIAARAARRWNKGA